MSRHRNTRRLLDITSRDLTARPTDTIDLSILKEGIHALEVSVSACDAKQLTMSINVTNKTMRFFRHRLHPRCETISLPVRSTMAKKVETNKEIAPKYCKSLRIPRNPCKSSDYVNADSRKLPEFGMYVDIRKGAAQQDGPKQ